MKMGTITFIVVKFSVTESSTASENSPEVCLHFVIILHVLLLDPTAESAIIRVNKPEGDTPA